MILSSFSEFINKTEMVSFSGFCRSIGWLFAVILLSVTASVILLRDTEVYMTWGIQIAGLVIGGLLGGSVVGAFSTKVVRESSEKYAPVMEAKARGKAAGAAAAIVIREQALDAAAKRSNGDTKDHPAISINNSEKTLIKPQDDERGTE